MEEYFYRINRKSFTVSTLNETEKSDRDYWLSKKPEERISAVEFLRQLIYNYDPSTERLQRVFETAEFKTS